MSAFDSICRTRSRVMLKIDPTSSNVRGHPSPIPKRSRMIRSSRWLSVWSTALTFSRNIVKAALLDGEGEVSSSMMSEICVSWPC